MIRFLFLAATPILAVLASTPTAAQTATPSVLPPLPITQSTVDRLGIDRTTGNISGVESVNIGNKVSSFSAGYDSGGGFPYTSYLEFERAVMPGGTGGGFMVARVAARGSVHVFSLGTIAQTYYNGHVAWSYHNFETSGVNDTYNDYNDDGAILVCSGPAIELYRGGTCSIYLAADGSRTDFRMPVVQYDVNLRSFWNYSTSTQVAYAWPTQVLLTDGEVLTYSYVNYSESDVEDPQHSGPGGTTIWNAVDSSLGFRAYLSGGTPTATTNPGTFDPPVYGDGARPLYAINTSREYADPLTLSRSFGPQSLSSVFAQAGSNSVTLVNNGVPIETITSSSSAPIGTTITKPNGGSSFYANVIYPSNYVYNYRGTNGAASSPPNAFPYLSFSVRRGATTSYSVSVDNVYYDPERYTGTVTNPDGSTESFVVQSGLLLSQTDELARTTSFGWNGAEGFFHSIKGFARLAKLQSVNRPDGSSIVNAYTHGAVSSSTVTPAGGGTALTTTVGLVASCTVANYRVCNKPTYIKDPKGNQTDYTYDPAHGGILTETLAADSAGVRPQKRYTYTQLTPAVLNSSGTLVGSPPVWRLTRMSECMSATAANPASCVGTAAERVTTYAYNDNNLFLTSTTVAAGDGTNSATTSYTYNYAGDVTVVDGPRTDVDDKQYTTYDALRRKAFEIGVDPDGAGGALPRPIVHHVYDADGNEVRTEFGTGNATDGSDFVVTRFKRMTYDAVTGQLLKTEEVLP